MVSARRAHDPGTNVQTALPTAHVLPASLALADPARPVPGVRPGRGGEDRRGAGRAGRRTHPRASSPGKPLWLGLLIRARAALAHLLEEPRRLRPADDARAGSCPPASRPARSSGRRRSGCRSGRSSTTATRARCCCRCRRPSRRTSAATSLDVRLRADWLVCKEVCIPQSGEFRLAVPAGAEHRRACRRVRAGARRAAASRCRRATVQATVDAQALRAAASTACRRPAAARRSHFFAGRCRRDRPRRAASSSAGSGDGCVAARAAVGAAQREPGPAAGGAGAAGASAQASRSSSRSSGWPATGRRAAAHAAAAAPNAGRRAGAAGAPPALAAGWRSPSPSSAACC